MKPFRQTLYRGPVIQVPRCQLSVGKQRVAPRPSWSRRASLSSEGSLDLRCATPRPQRTATVARGQNSFLQTHLASVEFSRASLPEITPAFVTHGHPLNHGGYDMDTT